MSPRFAFTPPPPARRHREDTTALPVSSEWHGEMIDDNGARSTFTLLRDDSATATSSNPFILIDQNGAVASVRLLEASNRAFVALVLPRGRKIEGRDEIIVLEGVRLGEQIAGRFISRSKGWRNVIRSGEFSANLVGSTVRAA